MCDGGVFGVNNGVLPLLARVSALLTYFGFLQQIVFSLALFNSSEQTLFSLSQAALLSAAGNKKSLAITPVRVALYRLFPIIYCPSSK